MERFSACTRRPRATASPQRCLATTAAVLLMTVGLVMVVASRPASAAPVVSSGAAAGPDPNPVTPGNFTGLGFDQCLAPEQWKMNRWLESSPFLAAGIYISGASRGCRDQPNLTPTWISTQLKNGWRLLPISLGPQASCHPGFPRYGNDPTIDPKPGRSNRYRLARKQGTAEAATTVAAATKLGITPGSTLWYDLEGFSVTNTHCRESALWFLSTYTERIRELGYVTGVYSSAGSGIKMLDDARVERPGVFTLPDRIWVARWDGLANTSTSYIREDGWRPGGRMKQYLGGHDERWGGVRINIDRNFLDLGITVAPAEKHCGDVRVNFKSYGGLAPPKVNRAPDPALVIALKCLLKERKAYSGSLRGTYGTKLVAAVHAWQARVGHPVRNRWSRKNWMSLLSAGNHPVVKRGSAGSAVRKVQRALNAASKSAQLSVTGIFDAATDAALREWQKQHELEVSGVAGTQSWAALKHGTR